MNLRFITSYNFCSNNPIIFIDQDGNKDYYFKGKKIASDNGGNCLIGIVYDNKIAKEIKKIRDLSKIENVENGSRFTGGFIIHKDILKSTVDIANKAYSKKGVNREFATSLSKTEDGDVSIHSHPTGFDETSFDTKPSTEKKLDQEVTKIDLRILR